LHVLFYVERGILNSVAIIIGVFDSRRQPTVTTCRCIFGLFGFHILLYTKCPLFINKLNLLSEIGIGEGFLLGRRNHNFKIWKIIYLSLNKQLTFEVRPLTCIKFKLPNGALYKDIYNTFNELKKYSNSLFY
jgi:hypothetical protein